MPDYDPSKQYSWKEDTQFSLNGNQFGLILNTFRNFLAKPESQEVMLVMKAETEMTKLLAQAIEKGDVKETTNSSIEEIDVIGAEEVIPASPKKIKKLTKT